jgi:serpin B
VYRSLIEQHVQVELPKFSFESSLDAKPTLLKMGLNKIFQDGAELGRMLDGNSSKSPVKVDKIVHKAKIAVDEDGAEAAAASAATIVLRNLIRPPNPTFVADHPFVFVIRHNRSNLPLFMGTVQRL